MTTRKIGRYELKSELGRGGMATVHLAHDPSMGRDVAVKILPRQFLHDPTFRGRFERETRTIAGLEHPAIVPVYDFGQEDEQPYLVMRHMAGGSLLERMQSGALTMEQISEILRRIGSALDYAHSKGIVHRDLKPGNILFDHQGNAFLTDFGIAKLAESTATFTGSAIIGTPAYMSPEQIQGEKDIDGRSDVYALGIILFEMITGRGPYRADTPAKVMMKHILDPIPHITEFKPNLPPAYDSVISRALAKKRDERYATARDMATDLNLAITGKFEPPALAGTMIEQPAVRPVEQTMIESPSRPVQPVSPPPSRQASMAPGMVGATQIEAPVQTQPQPIMRPAEPAEPAGQSKSRFPVLAVVLGGLALFLCVAVLLGGGAVAYFSGFFGGEQGTAVAAGTAAATTLPAGLETSETPESTATAEPPTDTPAPPTEEPTDTPTPEPTRVPLTFARVEDSTGRITAQFPDQWETVSSELIVAGSTDLDAWFDGSSGGEIITMPGLTLLVLDESEPATGQTLTNIIDGYEWPANCTFETGSEEPYEEGVYTGYYSEAECDSGRFVFVLLYDPDSPNALIWLEAYIVGSEDEEVLAEVLDTLFVGPVEVVEEPTPAPTGTTVVAQPTNPPPPPPSGTTKQELLAQMRQTQSDMQRMGGMIDNAVATGFINCNDVVSTYDGVAADPTFNVANSTPAVQTAHDRYRQSISIFLQGTRGITDNCRGIIGGSGGSIPFQQWGPARTSVNNALDVLNPAIEQLENS